MILSKRRNVLEYIIETQNLVKQYNMKLAVNNVSVHVKRGDIYGLIGKNGAGKTSLMKLILGLTYPTNGKIFLFGSESMSPSRLVLDSPLKNMKRAIFLPPISVTSRVPSATSSRCRSITTSIDGFSFKIASNAGRELE